MERRRKREKGNENSFLEFSFQNLTIFEPIEKTHEKGNLYALGQSARTRPLDGTRWKFQNNDIAGQRMLSLVEFTYTFPRDTQETNRFSLYLFRVAQSGCHLSWRRKRCRNDALPQQRSFLLSFVSFVSSKRPMRETIYIYISLSSVENVQRVMIKRGGDM